MVIGSSKVGNWNGWGDLDPNGAKGGTTNGEESAILGDHIKRCTVVRQNFAKSFS